MYPKTAISRNCFPLQTASVAYFQRKIQLSGFSAYLSGSPSQLIRISGVLPYWPFDWHHLKYGCLVLKFHVGHLLLQLQQEWRGFLCFCLCSFQFPTSCLQFIANIPQLFLVLFSLSRLWFWLSQLTSQFFYLMFVLIFQSTLFR